MATLSGFIDSDVSYGLYKCNTGCRVSLRPCGVGDSSMFDIMKRQSSWGVFLMLK